MMERPLDAWVLELAEWSWKVADPSLGMTASIGIRRMSHVATSVGRRRVSPNLRQIAILMRWPGAVRAWPEMHRDAVAIDWLPPYGPSPNRIERLWGHLKGRRRPTCCS